MMKEYFTGTYQGFGYRQGYGRKLYSRCVILSDVVDSNGVLVFGRVKVSCYKALTRVGDIPCGTRIGFWAQLVDGRLLYLSDVKVL